MISIQNIDFQIEPQNGSDITLAEVSIDGGNWISSSTQPTSGGNWNDGSHQWNTLSEADGSHVIMVRAQDDYGNWGSSSLVNVIVKNEVVLEILSPNAGDTIQGETEISFSIDPVYQHPLITIFSRDNTESIYNWRYGHYLWMAAYNFFNLQPGFRAEVFF